jgi:hypothetical protein
MKSAGVRESGCGALLFSHAVVAKQTTANALSKNSFVFICFVIFGLLKFKLLCFRLFRSQQKKPRRTWLSDAAPHYGAQADKLAPIRILNH